MVMLLTQYIDNACKYSIFGTTITIRAASRKAEVIFSVHSFGPVIPIADRERIFDRYYRSSTQLQSRRRHRHRPLGGQARGPDSRRLCLGHQR